jgi:RNA polymerase sigma-70 factor (ECF subfamily)
MSFLPRRKNKPQEATSPRDDDALPVDREEADKEEEAGTPDKVVWGFDFESSATPSRRSKLRDEELAAGMTRGELGNFDELFLRWSVKIQKYLMLGCGLTLVEAEDTAQDVFEKVIENVSDPGSEYNLKKPPFSAWIKRVAKNAAIDCKRKLRRATPVSQIGVSHMGAQDGSQEQILELVAEPSSTEEEALRLAKLADYFGCASKLAPRQKRAFEMRHVREMTQAQIAREMYITEQAVGTLLRKAHLNVRHCLEGKDIRE